MTPVKIVLGAALIVVAAVASLSIAHRVWAASGPLPSVGVLPEPRQEKLDYLKPLPGTPKHEFWALDSYEIEALVVSRKRYRWDREAEVSPVDLLLAWGEVAAHGNPERIRWSQRGRFGYWRYGGNNPPTVTGGTLNRSAANVHLIPPPDDSFVRRQILRIRRGDHVRLTGYLVRVEATSGWRWVSSRTRNDTGSGACEVIYVTNVEWL